MSIWSQVAMIFRVDYIDWDLEGELDFDQLFGKTYTWEQHADYEAHPETYLPMGSEGSLEMSVWTNPQESYADRYTVSIFGSLRDHYAKDVEALLAWFDQKCALEQLDLRQATLTIQNDEVGTVTKTYQSPRNYSSQSVRMEVGDIRVTLPLESLHQLSEMNPNLSGVTYQSELPIKLEYIPHDRKDA